MEENEKFLVSKDRIDENSSILANVSAFDINKQNQIQNPQNHNYLKDKESCFLSTQASHIDGVKVPEQRSARNIRRQGNSIINFNPFLPPKFTEKYTIMALEQLGLIGEDLMYPNESQINQITRDPKLKKMVRDHLILDANILIGEVKMRRDQLIKEEMKDKDEEKQEEINKEQDIAKMEEAIDQNYNNFKKHEVEKVILEILQRKHQAEKKKKQDEREEEYQRRLEEAQRRRQLQMLEKRKQHEERRSRLEIEQQKQFEDKMKKYLEKEQQAQAQIEHMELERRNNAYCCGVERDLKILSVKENIRELEEAKREKLAEKEYLENQREQLVKQRMQDEMEQRKLKILEKHHRIVRVNSNAKMIQEFKESENRRLVNEKEERTQQRLQEMEKQKSEERKIKAQLSQAKIENAARNRINLISFNQINQNREERNDIEKQKQEYLEKKYKKIEHERIEKRINEQMKIQQRKEKLQQEEDEKQQKLLQKIAESDKKVEQIKAKAIENQRKQQVQAKLKELTRKAAEQRIQRMNQNAANEVNERIAKKYSQIDQNIQAGKEIEEKKKKLQIYYRKERKQLSDELNNLLANADKISPGELEQIANRYNINLDELMKRALNQKKPRVPPSTLTV